MSVELTSRAVGQEAGTTYTGPAEDWLLAHGYAKRAGYTGVGVASTGPSDVTPDKDLTLAENREAADREIAANTDVDQASKQPFDVDLGGVDTEAPTVNSIEPNTGAAAGGEVVEITGTDLTNTTGVTFGGVAATDVEVVDETTVLATTPAHAAGAVDVVVTDNVGADTLTGGYTYA